MNLTADANYTRRPDRDETTRSIRPLSESSKGARRPDHGIDDCGLDWPQHRLVVSARASETVRFAFSLFREQTQEMKISILGEMSKKPAQMLHRLFCAILCQ